MTRKARTFERRNVDDFADFAFYLHLACAPDSQPWQINQVVDVARAMWARALRLTAAERAEVEQAAHEAADPHCTCNDCMVDYETRLS